MRLIQEAEHDGQEWVVGRQVLSQRHGVRWAEEVDPLTLAVFSGADGQLPMSDQIDVLAAAFDIPAPELATMLEPVVARLVERGYLEPVSAEPPAR